MSAVVAINLFPSGEIDQAYIETSSGDQAFDRSALQAVFRVERFERVSDVDPILFERRLRRILVTFRPEGLRW
jgi:colicin import membrane protein